MLCANNKAIARWNDWQSEHLRSFRTLNPLMEKALWRLFDTLSVIIIFKH